MKFSVTLKATKEFKTSISAIQAILEEATFYVTKEGLNFRGLDASNVTYIAMILPKDRFIKYECDTDTNFTVRTHEFLEVVKRAKNDEVLTLEMDDSTRALQIHVEGKKHYTLPLLAIEKDAPSPNFRLQTKTNLKFADFIDYVKDIAVVADNFVVTTDGNKLTIFGKGDSGKVELETNGVVEQKEEGELRGEYMLEFLSNMMKTIGSGFEDVVVEHGHNLPLKLTFNSETGTLVYVQAPKVL